MLRITMEFDGSRLGMDVLHAAQGLGEMLLRAVMTTPQTAGGRAPEDATRASTQRARIAEEFPHGEPTNVMDALRLQNQPAPPPEPPNGGLDAPPPTIIDESGQCLAHQYRFVELNRDRQKELYRCTACGCVLEIDGRMVQSNGGREG